VTRHRVALRQSSASHSLSELADGRAYTVYGQQEVVKDLIDLRLAPGWASVLRRRGHVHEDVNTKTPYVDATMLAKRFACALTSSRGAMDRSERRIARYRVTSFVAMNASTRSRGGHPRRAPPATEELIYGRHEEGFVLYSMLSPTLSRLYLGVRPDDTLEQWSDDRIWSELAVASFHRRGLQR